ncbi:hypothetical protein OAF98_03975 [Planctomicrobium sp.]|nr:enolase C-terminal domain-like protein [Planctomicrobium sp.]MDA7527869.1 hypothetical protein [bacterium]MDB4733170.1 hypothetical protein [Planctomicrobium sp.]MDB4743621.1 hypothetical protein [Planctomicrobium sp.]
MISWSRNLLSASTRSKSISSCDHRRVGICTFCDAISVCPGENDGLRKSLNIVELAAKQNVACSIGSNLELDIASAAMCHLVLAHKNMQVEKFPGDIMGPIYHSVRIVTNPLQIDGPNITTSDRPGLGVDVNWSIVEKHSM